MIRSLAVWALAVACAVAPVHAAVVANAESGTRASLDVRFNHGPPFFTDSHPRTDTRVVLRV